MFRIATLGGLIAAGTMLAACQPRGAQEEPIFEAVRQNDAAAVSAYLGEGGDPDARNRNGDPLIYIASGPKGGSEVLQLLLSAGADTAATSEEGRTPLQNAASWCDTEIVALLIAGGADVSLPGKDGETPLESVCISPQDRREAVLALFDEAGAGPE